MKQDYTIINKIMEIDNNYIDDKAINRVKKYLVAPWLKYIILCGVLFELVMAIYLFMQSCIISPLIFLVFATIIASFYPLLVNRTAKIYLLQQEEVFGDEPFEYKIIFDEDKLISISKYGYGILKYKYLKNIVQTEKEYVFISKTGRYILCQKENMTNENIIQLTSISKKYSINMI